MSTRSDKHRAVVIVAYGTRREVSLTMIEPHQPNLKNELFGIKLGTLNLGILSSNHLSPRNRILNIIIIVIGAT